MTLSDALPPFSVITFTIMCPQQYKSDTQQTGAKMLPNLHNELVRHQLATSQRHTKNQHT